MLEEVGQLKAGRSVIASLFPSFPTLPQIYSRNMPSENSINSTFTAIYEVIAKPLLMSRFEYFGTICGAVFVFLVGVETIPLIQGLLILASFDFVIGVLRDHKQGKAIKAGLMAKTPAKIVTYLVVIATANSMGSAVRIHGLASLAAIFYMAVEARSILTSADLMGVPIPKSLKSLVKERIDKEITSD